DPDPAPGAERPVAGRARRADRRGSCAAATGGTGRRSEDGGMTAPAEPRPRFRQGQRVRVASRPSVGHCRTPMYLRGQPATVIALAGRFANPEELAYHQPGLPPIPLYRVRFRHDDLWPDFRGNP